MYVKLSGLSQHYFAAKGAAVRPNAKTFPVSMLVMPIIVAPLAGSISCTSLDSADTTSCSFTKPTARR